MDEAPVLNIAGILRSYFAAKPEVIMAFLFGSIVTGNRTSESDIDIVVYLLPAQKGFEVEGISQYECEDDIWCEVEKIIHENVDLVVLNYNEPRN
jgi:predicted nucleotidyltransferase